QGIMTAADCICPLINCFSAAILASGHIPMSSACSIITFFPAGHPNLSAQLLGVFACCSVKVAGVFSTLFSFLFSPHPIRKNDKQRLREKLDKIVFFIIIVLVVYRYFLNHFSPSP